MSAATDPEFDRLLSRLRFRHLQLIVELGRNRSLRSSAAAFGVTQPALGRTLGEIEAAFGFPMFVRSARGVTPTAAGEVAIRGATLLLEEVARLRADAAKGSEAQALIRLGAPPFLAQGYLPPKIAALAGREPPVRVQLTESGYHAVMDALVHGRLDAVVCPISGLAGLSGLTAGAGLRFEPLFTADYTVIARPSHPLARRVRVPWDVLARERWILPPPGSLMFSIIEERFVRAGLALPVPAIETGTPVTVVRMAAAGIGIAVVPSLTLSYLRAQGDVSRLRAHPPVPSDEVGLILRAGPEHPRLALLREALRGAKRDRRA